MKTLILMATAETSDGGILGALGIDVSMLVFQIIAFLILVGILGKWAYPTLIKAIDKRHDDDLSAAEAAKEAEAKAALVEADMSKLLKKARTEANDIVATAKKEANNVVDTANQKAQVKADAIVRSATEQIEKDISAARKKLYDETIDLVALATEKVVDKTFTEAVDKKVIADAVREAR